MSSRQDVLRGQRTLACALQGAELAAMRLTIELKDGRLLRGAVEAVDLQLGVSLRDAVTVPHTASLYSEPPAKQSHPRFDAIFVAGKHLRYVHMPNTAVVEQLILDRIERTRAAAEVYKRKPKAAQQARETAAKRRKLQEERKSAATKGATPTLVSDSTGHSAAADDEEDSAHRTALAAAITPSTARGAGHAS